MADSQNLEGDKSRDREGFDATLSQTVADLAAIAGPEAELALLPTVSTAILLQAIDELVHNPSRINSKLIAACLGRLIDMDANDLREELNAVVDSVEDGNLTHAFLMKLFIEVWAEKKGLKLVKSDDLHTHISEVRKLVQEAPTGNRISMAIRTLAGRTPQTLTTLMREAEVLAANNEELRLVSEKLIGEQLQLRKANNALDERLQSREDAFKKEMESKRRDVESKEQSIINSANRKSEEIIKAARDSVRDAHQLAGDILTTARKEATSIVDSANARRAQLESEIARLQATRDALSRSNPATLLQAQREEEIKAQAIRNESLIIASQVGQILGSLDSKENLKKFVKEKIQEVELKFGIAGRKKAFGLAWAEFCKMQFTFDGKSEKSNERKEAKTILIAAEASDYQVQTTQKLIEIAGLYSEPTFRLNISELEGLIGRKLTFDEIDCVCIGLLESKHCRKYERLDEDSLRYEGMKYITYLRKVSSIQPIDFGVKSIQRSLEVFNSMNYTSYLTNIRKLEIAIRKLLSPEELAAAGLHRMSDKAWKCLEYDIEHYRDLVDYEFVVSRSMSILVLQNCHHYEDEDDWAEYGLISLEKEYGLIPSALLERIANYIKAKYEQRGKEKYKLADQIRSVRWYFDGLGRISTLEEFEEWVAPKLLRNQ